MGARTDNSPKDLLLHYYHKVSGALLNPLSASLIVQHASRSFLHYSTSQRCCVTLSTHPPPSSPETHNQPHANPRMFVSVVK